MWYRTRTKNLSGRTNGLGVRTALSRSSGTSRKTAPGSSRANAFGFRFVESQRGGFLIGRPCQGMNVSPRGLRAFRNRPASCGPRMGLAVLAHIKEQSRLSLGSYGRPRMTEKMTETGVDVSHRRVGLRVRETGIVIERTRQFEVRRDQQTVRWMDRPDARRIAILG